ncbi:ATP-binding protein [Candidatus Woesearchaeota archaeon]|nr:ATP-binding protein [Candidatus Woesearchaeota archaeon]
MDLSLLELQNPWWQGKDDFHLRKLAEQKYCFMPSIIPLEQLKKSSIHTLIGPRQIGKTTYLKLLIRELLKSHKPRTLFYYSCENNSKEQLREVLLFYLTTISHSERNFIFLDEVSLVEGWESVELELFNKGLLEKTTLLNSGSSSLNLKKSAERLPGRKGTGKIHYYFPLTFREFVFLVEKEAGKIAEKPELFLSRLQSLLLDYVRSSGFPLIINRAAVGHLDDAAYDIYHDWIEGEISKAKRSVNFSYQIFSRILGSFSSQLNWESIAQHSSIGSHTTIAEYVDLFDSLFIVKVVPLIGSDLRVYTAKNKKIYFFDHFLFSVLEKSVYKINDYAAYFAEKIKDETYLSKIMENIVFSNLLCHIVSSGYDITNTLFYWRSKTQEEIDFLVYVRKGTKKTIIPIEVKYQNAAFSRLATFQPIFLTKNEYDEKARKIPLALFLFQLPQRVKI